MRWMPRLICGCLLWAISSATAWSAGVFCGQPKTFDYLPATNHYVIVQPKPIQRTPCDKSARPCTWPIQHLSAEPYPYGWFGARPKAQPSRNGSFYGDYRDYKWNLAP
jgi:hypothetical protein